MQYSNTFVQYTKSLALSRHAPLSAEEERELFLLYKSGGEKAEEAFQKLVNTNLRLVVFILNRDFLLPEDVDIMDVVQEGNLGLIEGIKRFNSDKYNCRVNSYCAYWIYFFISRSLGKSQRSRLVFSTYDNMEEDIKEIVLKDSNSDKSNDSVDYDLMKKVKCCFNYLSIKEQKILEDYYGLSIQGNSRTLQEIGSMLHINLERVRQLKESAIKKIQDKINFERRYE